MENSETEIDEREDEDEKNEEFDDFADDEDTEENSMEVEKNEELSVLETYIHVGYVSLTANGDVTDGMLYQYDENFVRECERQIFKSGKYIENKYNSDGQKIEVSLYDVDGSRLTRETLMYDEYGNCNCMINDPPYQKNDRTYVYQYGATGRMREKKVKNKAGEYVDGRVKYEYDIQGNLSKEYTYTLDNVLTNEKQYDKNGNLLEERGYSAGTVVFERTREYDDNGNMSKETIYQDGISIPFLYENEYDANGNLIKVTKQNEVGDIEQIQMHMYIKKDNFANVNSLDEMLALLQIDGNEMIQPDDNREVADSTESLLTLDVTWNKLPQGRTEEVKLLFEMHGTLDNGSTINATNGDGSIYASDGTLVAKVTERSGAFNVEFYCLDGVMNCAVLNGDTPDTNLDDWMLYGGHVNADMEFYMKLHKNGEPLAIMHADAMEDGFLLRSGTGIWYYGFDIDHGNFN